MKPLDYTPLKVDYISIAKASVFKYINTADFKIFVFGSRAKNTNHRFSDLDIGIIGAAPLPSHILLSLENELAQSRIPFKVDVVDFSTADEAFKREAMKDVVWWND
jgi:predicted nucleotidyltransferase